ncbi:hypothetical protein QZM62_09285 [Burkholderia multivorans]|nr:hypothetical protein [Burkholderia multivorans]
MNGSLSPRKVMPGGARRSYHRFRRAFDECDETDHNRQETFNDIPHVAPPPASRRRRRTTGEDLMTSTRMTSPALHLERTPVDGICPACESTRLARYPVHSEGGWFDVVKCQACLHSIRREPASRLGPVLRLLSDTL